MSLPRKKTYLVTGGTHGIGRACVEALAAQGGRVLFIGRDEEAGSQLAERLPGCTFVRADIADAEACRAAANQAIDLGEGSLDGLVNNAGMTLRKAFVETSLQQWDEVFDVNVRSAFLFTRAALPALIRAKGSVVAVSSVAGLVGAEGLVAYTASKAALIGMMRSLAIECGRDVRFNTVCPGQIGTRMMTKALSDEQNVARLLEGIPAGRIGDPRDVALAVVWLLSEMSAYVNGAVFPIDGGETSGFASAG
ncbi:SDR family NAD(P)-dependent oxidoreductase [Mesorhizobium sp.]|uniref:SDR family NAD(P)-dependent oxidoreductase n=1 Tax=Mesorhizobium sp. TaxID=1871066 RepID=UPI0025C17527|nr:SDR family NAD(P)-dependent oxidoreductase [Mesorhizobium sp.]